MSSLTGCLKKAGTFLRPEDKAEILSLARGFRAKGMTPSEAAREAVKEQLAAVDAKVQTHQRPLIAKQAPEAAPSKVEVREVPGGFEAYRDGKKVGYLKDNLERGQAKQLGESANVDMVKVDADEQGKGTGRALYAAFSEKHEGAIMPSGKTEPSAWKLWKRNYPEKVDAFVKQEAERIKGGADSQLVAGNITDPEIRSRVLQEAQDGQQQLRPDDLQPAAAEKAPQKGDAPEPPEEIFSTQKETPFYSPLNRAIEGLKMDRAPAQGWLDTIKGLASKGIKADEVEWSGVREWLGTREGKVTKAELQAFLKEGGVKVEEVTKGGAGGVPEHVRKWLEENGYDMPDSTGSWLDHARDAEARAKQMQKDGRHREARENFEVAERMNEMAERLETDSGKAHGAPKYSSYQLPGGTNYREVLLTLPVKPKAAPEVWDVFNSRTQKSRQFATRAEAEAAAKTSDDFVSRVEAGGPDPYKSPHWEEPNVLAHIRLNDRIDAEGRKVLFVEEVQSDWAQQGKKRGFADNEPEQKWLVRKPGDAVSSQHDTQAEAQQAMQSLARAYGETPEVLGLRVEQGVDRNRPREGVPTAPFVGKTDAWTALAIKRITKMAVDEGYDRVAFINGEQSAARYDLSKHIDRIDYNKNADGTFNLSAIKDRSEVFSKEDMSADELADHVGKDVAEKMVRGEGSDPEGSVNRWEPEDLGDATPPKSLSGLDLKVGGEGMKAFYDKIVPNVAKDVVRKLGGDGLTTSSIASGEPKRMRPVATNPHTWQIEDENGQYLNGHGNWVGSPLNALEFRSLDAAQKHVNAQAAIPIAQTAFDITPKMRENAAGGVPLFKGGAEGGKPLGSPEAVEAAFREQFGNKLIDGLKEQGLIKYALALDEGMTGDNRGVRAVFRQKPGEAPAATFYFDRLTAEQAPGMLMHELGEHFGAPRLLGEQRYALVMDELKGLAKTDPEVKASWDHVAHNYIGEGTPNKIKLGDDTFMREVAAHLVETQPNLPWVRRLINEIRAFFYEHFGTTMGNRVDAELIRGLAAAALRKASTGGLAGQRPTPRQFRPFVPSRTVMGSAEKRPPIQ